MTLDDKEWYSFSHWLKWRNDVWNSEYLFFSFPEHAVDWQRLDLLKTITVAQGLIWTIYLITYYATEGQLQTFLECLLNVLAHTNVFSCQVINVSLSKFIFAR